jgi:hypothetical protein
VKASAQQKILPAFAWACRFLRDFQHDRFKDNHQDKKASGPEEFPPDRL